MCDEAQNAWKSDAIQTRQEQRKAAPQIADIGRVIRDLVIAEWLRIVLQASQNFGVISDFSSGIAP